MIKENLVTWCSSLHNANIMLAVLLLRCMQKQRTLKKEVERNKDVYQCCRTCMCRDGLQSIFGNDDEPESISEKLLEASGLQITKDDGLPQHMCGNCIKSVNDVIKFRKTCKKIEHSLLGLGFKKTDKKIIANKLKINEDRLKSVSITKTEKYNEKYKRKVKKRLHKKKKKLKITGLNELDDLFDTSCADDQNNTDNSQAVELYDKNPSVLATEKKKNEIVVPDSLKCTICDKILKNKHTYVRHMVVHTGEYPYMCEQCGKGLMAHTHLVTHMKAKHGWERTDKCSFCGYLALNKSILQIHERRHTGEKPFVCDHCGMGFHRRANLLQHLPVHLPTKTVQCALCPSAFKSVRFLRTHYNKKHKQKKYTYICHLCKNYFKTTGNVRMHLFRIHGIPKEEQGPVHRIMINDGYMY